MGFKRLDDTTVVDDDGNKYFMPGTPDQEPDRETIPPANDADPARQDPKDKTIEGLLSYLNRAPADDIEMPEDNVNVPKGPAIQDKEEIAPLAAEAAAHETAPPVPLTPQEQRDAAIKGDLSAFTKGGNTLDTDREVAEAQGGIADEQAQSAMVKAKGAEDVNKVMNEAAVARADAANKAATALTEDAKKHYQWAEDKTAEWEKDVKESSKAIVDPNRAFTTMGGFGRAMWAVQFIGAGMQGGQQVTATWGVLQKVLQDDIESQRSTNANRREGLSSEGQALRERIANTKELDAVNAKAMALRLDALNKELDARIKSIGQDAARKAGLLDAQVAINQGVMKLQMTVREQNLKKAEEKTKQVFELHKQDLQGNIDRINEDAKQRHQLANDLILEKDKAKTAKEAKITDLPTGTGLGLTAIDQTTGKPVDAVKLVANPEQRQKAGAILSAANEEASLLQEVEQDVKKMSKSDLIRGGGPEFAAKALELIQNRAKRFNGSRLSDADVQIAAKNEFGLDVATSGGFFSHLKGALLAPGDFKEGVEKAIATHRRNLASETTNQLQPYIESGDAKNLNIQYNPQNVRVKAPENTQRDVNTMIEQAAEGAPTRKIEGQAPRKPLTGPQAVDENTVAAYEDQKDKGRGKPGGLPVLSEHDEAWVDRFSDDLKELHSRHEDTEANVTAVQDGYLNNKKLSDEAKFEIQNTAFEALATYKAKAKQAEDSKKLPRVRMH